MRNIQHMTLTDFLHAHGLTATEFAAMIGRSKSFVSRIQSGDAAPGLETLQAIQRVTKGKVTPADFHRRKHTTPKFTSPQGKS